MKYFAQQFRRKEVFCVNSDFGSIMDSFLSCTHKIIQSGGIPVFVNFKQNKDTNSNITKETQNGFEQNPTYFR